MSRNKKGFTLIELLIVVVIIGILAAIAIPKFANTKDKAYVAAMKSDLRNMATYEEQYAADNNGAYFGGTATSAGASAGFQPVAERDGRDYEPRRPAAFVERDRNALAVSEGLRHDQRRDHLRLSFNCMKTGTANAVPVFLCPTARANIAPCERGDSNPHGLLHWILSPARLPNSATSALALKR